MVNRLVLTVLGLCVVAGSQADSYPDRLKRSESFLGVHFDFHASWADKQIGNNVTPEMVETIIDKVQPDFIQIDCKGHSGFSSYPTQAGNPAGGFVGDPLKVWREVTAQRGVALYMHYSGVFDEKAVIDHPEWAAVMEDGSPHKTSTSVFGAYVDQLMIPQLKELRSEYGVDGYWIDGECWAAKPDYHPKVIELFTQKTGISKIPHSPNQPHWYEWMEFQREGFRNYLRHYTDTLHKEFPDVEIMSNWAFSSMMPEPVTVGLDHLSGDFSCANAIRSARWECRCIRNQGLPWDLVAWAFSGRVGDLGWRTAKTAEQLQREAAMVLACGGGFQCYFGQMRDGSVRLAEMDMMGQVAQFCRDRQEFCHHAESVPQIALIYHTEALYRKATELFNPGVGGFWTPINGILNALLDGQHHVDVVMDHQIRGNCARYPLIVFPEWGTINPELHQELVAYVNNGGNLLVIGAQSAALFQDELGLAKLDPAGIQTRWLRHENRSTGLKVEMAEAALSPDTQSRGVLNENNNPLQSNWPAGSICSMGKGKIAGIYANLGGSYYSGTNTVTRDYLSALVRELMPNPLVEVTGSPYVDLVVNKISLDGHERYAINLVSTAGPHRDLDVFSYDQVPAVGPLKVTIRIDNKPEKIVCQPGGEEMDFSYHDSKVSFQLDRLNIHKVFIVFASPPR